MFCIKISTSYLNSTEIFSNVIRFYDGVCLWEEGGSTAAIHSEWAKNLIKVLSSFPQSIHVSCKKLLAGTNTDTNGDVNPVRSRKMKLILSTVDASKIKS